MTRFSRIPLLAAITVFWTPAEATVVINEIQPSNGTTLLDEDGDASDWIELLNTGSEPVNLEGWGLSDRANEPFMWIFPSHTLGPGERLLAWASGKDRVPEAGGGGEDPDPPPATAAPNEIPGLVVWLNAEAETFNDNTWVSTWTDRSGRGNHAHAPTFDNTPQFRTNRINGRPSLTFNRAWNEHLLLPTSGFTGMDHLSDFTVMTVARWQGANQAGLFGAYNHPANNHVHFEFRSGNSLRLRVGGNDLSAGSAAIAGDWEIFGGSMNNADDAPILRIFRRTEQIGSKPGSSGSTLLANYGTLGVGISDTGRSFDGEMAEFMIYNRALTLDERVKLANHLSIRYGFQEAPEPPGDEQFHTNFSISAEGEDLVLTRPDGTTADLVPAIAIPRDASYGRSPDATGTFAFFADPTPETANTSTPYGPPVRRPEFSHPRGFYDAPFQLALSHADPAVTIHYTTDGSQPGPGRGEVYSAPIGIPTTRIVRAVAVKPGALPLDDVETHSYLFLNHVAQVTEQPDGYPSSWGSFNQTSYAMSPFVASRPGYAARMRAALESLPVLSLSASVDDLFGGGGAGVYSNPNTDGLEKEVSAEWIGLEDVDDFQIDAGLRVQGGASRNFSNSPKKSLRLLFKSEYGPGRLEAPVLRDGSGVEMDQFNTLVLRADYNNSWLHWDDAQRLRGTLVRDQWARDTQIAMSGSGSGGNHVHLFLNGIYWGIYNPSERPDAAFAATYFGGEREDYDAMTHSGIRDGDNIAWEQMRNIAQSDLSIAANYEAMKEYLDIDHFIDYMIVNIYGANSDWPGNNWNAVRKRESGAGYLFYCWDAERTLENAGANRVNLSGNNNPAEFYAALRDNPEFRLRFGDRVHLHFFNGGALTPQRNIERYATRAEIVGAGIFGEEARWGAYRHEIYDRDGPSPRYSVDEHWNTERDRLLHDYFPIRSEIVVNQFRGGGLYPSVDAPAFSKHGGILAEEEPVTISAGTGVIYYTTDGSDSRLEGGAVAPGAQTYSGPVMLDQAGLLKARVLYNGQWSALNEAAFQVVLEEPSFLPGGSGDWNQHANWTGGIYPDGTGQKARIAAPAADDRNVNIRTPITAGSIRFDEGASPYRNRLRDQGENNTLTFDGGEIPACIRVDGDGTGFVEIEVAAGTILATDLELEVNHLAGNEDHGALRLRSDWSGYGGIIKTGLGTASFTGGGKNFTGALEIRDGVLRLTEPSTPSLASSVTIKPGGQIRLTSGGFRVYGFGTPLTIEGPGRSEEIPDGEGEGRLGAIRYHPGSGFNQAVIPQPVHLAGAASIHVNGSGNTLDLDGPVTGSHPLVKSGGGTLRLLAESPAFDGHLALENGRLDISGGFEAAVLIADGAVLTGHGVTGGISGEGTVDLGQSSIHAPSATGVTLTARIGRTGAPQWNQPSSAGNGFLRLAAAPAGPAAIRAYVTAEGELFQGLLFVPESQDLAALLVATPVEIFTPDPAGTHEFEGQFWSPMDDAHVFAVAATADFGDGPVSGKTLEIRVGDLGPSFESWLDLAFPDPADRTDPAISGPHADPFGTGLPNLVRYALRFDPLDPHAGQRPLLVKESDSLRFRFPFDPELADIAYVIEGTIDLTDWNEATIYFDSRIDPPADLADGILEVELPMDAPSKFYRLKVIQL